MKKKITLKHGCIRFLCVYVLVAVGFYLIAGEQLQYKSVPSINNNLTHTEAVGELYDGISVEQSFVSDTEAISAISLIFATYNRVNMGEVEVRVIDSSIQREIFHESIDASTLKDNSIYMINFDEPIEGLLGKELTIRVTSNTVGVQNAITVYKNASGAICLGVDGKDIIPFGKYYYGFVTVLGITFLIYCLNLFYKEKKSKKSYGLAIINAFVRYRFLLDQLVARDFKTKYKRSVLGVLWSFLNPLLTMLVQYIVFSTIFKSDIPNFLLYLLIGVIFFNFFSEATSMSLSSITSNASLITKVYVPKYIYPIARILSSSINLFLSLIPLFVVALMTGTNITWSYLLLPFCIFCMIAFCLGIGFILSASMVFFRDTQFLWGVVSMMWMYATPIFYPETIIPAQFLTVYKMNPLYHIIRFTRTIIIDGVSPEPKAYLLCFLASFTTLVVGAIIFKKTQDRFVLHI